MQNNPIIIFLTALFVFLFFHPGCETQDPDNATTTISSTTSTSAGESDAGIDLVMVNIPGGMFAMGCSVSDLECSIDESPRHSVTLSAFQISAYEMTQAQWENLMGYNPSTFSACPDCPVETVSWDTIQEFIETLNQQTGMLYRLPFEAEWEYAARAGSGTKWYCGDDQSCLNDSAWYFDTLSGHNFQPQPAGLKTPNAWGLYDMTGNVWEWCQDWYDADYYTHSPDTDPKGPATGLYRVIRGGDWESTARECRVSNRSMGDISLSSDHIGFRLVLDNSATRTIH